MNLRRKILIVEDDLWLQDNLKKILQKNDYDVQCASDGEEGYQKTLNWRPDMIVTDVMMPKRNGLDLAAEIRKVDAQIRLLFITAGFKDPKLEKRYRKEFAKTANCTLLLKPFKSDILVQLIQYMLAGRLMM